MNFLSNYFSSYNEILTNPSLYIGDIFSSYNKQFLNSKNIKLIVNCAENLSNNYPNDYTYFNIPVLDTETDNKKMFMYLDNAVNKIRLFHNHGYNVLVHCYAGKSRSATVVAAYLIKFYNFNVYDAVNFIVSKRHQTFDGGKNIVFLETLKRYQNTIQRR